MPTSVGMEADSVRDNTKMRTDKRSSRPGNKRIASINSETSEAGVRSRATGKPQKKKADRAQGPKGGLRKKEKERELRKKIRAALKYIDEVVARIEAGRPEFDKWREDSRRIQSEIDEIIRGWGHLEHR